MATVPNCPAVDVAVNWKATYPFAGTPMRRRTPNEGQGSKTEFQDEVVPFGYSATQVPPLVCTATCVVELTVCEPLVQFNWKVMLPLLAGAVKL